MRRYGLNYGPLRLWGSAAFVVGAFACGLLVDLIAAKHLIWVIATVAVTGALISLGLPPLEAPKPTDASAHGDSRLLRDPAFVAIIATSALVQGSHDNEGIAQALASIIALGRKLGLTVVAEGVETPQQLALLRKIDCNQVQGFLISHAVSSDQFQQLLNNDGPATSH